MSCYGARDLAASFRTVRKNTITIAEDIPGDQYNYRPVDGTRSVGELLTHIAIGGKFQEQINLVEKRTTMEGFDLMKFRAFFAAEIEKPRTKAEIIALLKESGEQYASA